MKTIAIKVDETVHAQLNAIAALEETTVTELVRDAVVQYLATKQADGTLAAKAETLLEEIDREAAARRQAIEDMVGSTGAAAKGRTRKAPARSGDGPAT